MNKNIAIISILMIALMALTSISSTRAESDLVSLPAGCRTPDSSDLRLDKSRLLLEVNIKGSGQTAYVSPGETVSGTCKYQIYSGSYNDAEINQGFFIMSWTTTWPASSGYYILIWNGISGSPPGVTNTKSFTFTAPTSPGTYYLYWCGGAEYGMTDAVKRYSQRLTPPAHAEIVVQPDTPPNNPPSASFYTSPTGAKPGQSLTFYDTSTDSDGAITSWHWEFGDGATATSQNPTHTYSDAGTFTTRLTVTDNKGATDTEAKTSTISDDPPSPTQLWIYGLFAIAVGIAVAGIAIGIGLAKKRNTT